MCQAGVQYVDDLGKYGQMVPGQRTCRRDRPVGQLTQLRFHAARAAGPTKPTQFGLFASHDVHRGSTNIAVPDHLMCRVGRVRPGTAFASSLRLPPTTRICGGHDGPFGTAGDQRIQGPQQCILIGAERAGDFFQETQAVVKPDRVVPRDAGTQRGRSTPERQAGVSNLPYVASETHRARLTAHHARRIEL